MVDKQLMTDGNDNQTDDDIHDFGVEVVFNQLRKEGYEIQSVNTKTGMNPQIIAKKDTESLSIVVRTACYPDKVQLEDFVRLQMIEHAKIHGAAPYFDSVGIANANTAIDNEMSVPVSTYNNR